MNENMKEFKLNNYSSPRKIATRSGKRGKIN